MTVAPRPRRDPLGRHRSSPGVAAAVARLVPAGPRGEVLDLCCGAGALSSALAALAPIGRLTTVDVDPGCWVGAGPPADATHLVADALDPALDGAVPPGSFDLALCNPPFGAVARLPAHDAILAAAGLAPDRARRTLDLAWPFLARCLLAVRPGGIVALVAPDGMATGATQAPLRAALLASHGLLHAATLPRGGFRGADPGAAILVVARGRPSREAVPLSRLGADGRPVGVVHVPPEDAVRRLDHDHHASPVPTGPCLRDLGAVATRGLVDAPRRHPGPVFHTTDFPRGDGRRDLRLPPSADPTARGVARGGDVVVARIGRGLERKVCGIAEGAVAVSSAVHVLRIPSDVRDATLDWMSSPDGARALAASTRGGGAPMLAKADLLRLVPFLGAGRG